MKFKLVYIERSKKLHINCLDSAIIGTIIPEDTKQHVHFPIPKEMMTIITQDMNDLLDQSISDEFNKIDKDIRDLQLKRQKMLEELREEINPKIIDVCENFKMKHAEHYV